MELIKDFSEFNITTHEEWLKSAVASLKGKPIEKLEKINSFGFQNKILFSEGKENNLPMPEKTNLLTNLEIDKYLNVKEITDLGADPITEIASLLRSLQENDNTNILISVAGDVFENIAKLRALRKLLNALKNENELSDFTITAYTGLLNKSNLDINNNILRLTLECFAAIVGGADNIYLRDFKNNEGEFEKRITHNIYHLLNEESYLNNVSDPAKGSSYIENVTEFIAEISWNLFLKYQEMNYDTFKLSAISSAKDYFNKISENINSRKSKMIGVNIFANPDDKIENFSIGGPEKRLSQAYEVFRVNASNYFIKNQKQASVQILCFGELKDYKARLDFVRDFFAVGDIQSNILELELVEDAVNTVLVENNLVYIIVAKDEIYKEIVVDLAKQIKNKNDEIELVLAGYPQKEIERFSESGIDRYIHIKSNIYEELTKTWQKFL